MDLKEKRLVATKYDINVTNALYSSILGLVTDYLTKLFPPNYLAYIYVGNSIAALTESNLDDDTKMVKDNPNFSIKMNYAPQDSSFNGDPFLMGNMLVWRDVHAYKHAYSRILADFNEQVFISGFETRAKHSFDITVTVNTEMEALNLQGFLRQKLGINRPYFLNRRFIEVPLPKSLIGAIAAVKGFDFTTPQNVQDFNRYLDGIADGVVTYKKHSISGKYLYFYKYCANLLFRVEGFDDIDTQREGKVITSSSVKFTCSVEYNNHQSFISECYKVYQPTFTDEDFVLGDNEVGAIIHWATNFVVQEQLPDGRKCIAKIEVVTDVNTPLDSTCFKPELASIIIKYIEALKVAPIPDGTTDTDPFQVVNSKVKLMVFRDTVPLKLNDDFTIDWNTYTININNPRYNYEYRIFIYVPMSEVGALAASQPIKGDTIGNALIEDTDPSESNI
jgi:hypothetical protein